MIIDKFEGKYRFLSNFYPSHVDLATYSYPTVEHAFQAAKTPLTEERFRIRIAPTPGAAKRLGRTVLLFKNWDEIKQGVMKDLVYQKFSNDPLLSMLLDTGDAELIEGNTWGDVYWGVYQGMGENNLGKILMQVRKELKLLHKTTVV